MRRPEEVTPVGTIIREQRVYDNPYLTVIERVIEAPNGSVRPPHYLWDKGGRRFVIAFATTKENETVLVREPKYGQMNFFISLPTGAVEEDEDDIIAVARELYEETGYQCSEWKQINGQPLVDNPDKIDGGEHNLFFGKNATKVGESQGVEEAILMTADQLREAIINGEVRIPMSIAGICIGLEYSNEQER